MDEQPTLLAAHRSTTAKMRVIEISPLKAKRARMVFWITRPCFPYHWYRRYNPYTPVICRGEPVGKALAWRFGLGSDTIDGRFPSLTFPPVDPHVRRIRPTATTIWSAIRHWFAASAHHACCRGCCRHGRSHPRYRSAGVLRHLYACHAWAGVDLGGTVAANLAAISRHC